MSVRARRWAEILRREHAPELDALRDELRGEIDTHAPWHEIVALLVDEGLDAGVAHQLVARVFHPRLMRGTLRRTRDPWTFEGEPVTAYHISNTARLVLFGMDIELDPELGQLTQLRQLIIPRARLRALPESIGRLSQLRLLYLRDNHLRKLPASLGQLRALTELNLGANRLRALPPALGQLSSLRKLSLHNNRIEQLPDTLGELEQLEHLNLYGNNLSEVPAVLFRLRGLRSLNLRRNPIPPEQLRAALREFPNLIHHTRPRYSGDRDYPLGRHYVDL